MPATGQGRGVRCEGIGVTPGVCLSPPTGLKHRSNLGAWVSPVHRFFRGGPFSALPTERSEGVRERSERCSEPDLEKGKGPRRSHSVPGYGPFSALHVQHIGLVAKFLEAGRPCWFSPLTRPGCPARCQADRGNFCSSARHSQRLRSEAHALPANRSRNWLRQPSPTRSGYAGDGRSETVRAPRGTVTACTPGVLVELQSSSSLRGQSSEGFYTRR